MGWREPIPIANRRPSLEPRQANILEHISPPPGCDKAGAPERTEGLGEGAHATESWMKYSVRKI